MVVNGQKTFLIVNINVQPMVNVYVSLPHIVVVIITNVSMVISKNKCVHCINSIQSKRKLAKIFKSLLVVRERNVLILVRHFDFSFFFNSKLLNFTR